MIYSTGYLYSRTTVGGSYFERRSCFEKDSSSWEDQEDGKNTSMQLYHQIAHHDCSFSQNTNHSIHHVGQNEFGV